MEEGVLLEESIIWKPVSTGWCHSATHEASLDAMAKF
jgi:hypothetical protein